MSIRPVFIAFALTVLSVQPASALTIMLTNDDGYQHPWVRTLQATLKKAGHSVTMVAPDENQSGKAAALSLGALRSGDKAVIKHSDDVYSVKGTPATAALLGIKDVMPERPQLIISGINEGANIGVLSSFSGTVGATVAVLHLAGEPIPAIAISSNLLDQTSEADSEANLQHAKEISEYMVRLIASLEGLAGEKTAGKDAPLLPTGIALNVNYPTVTKDKVKGSGIYRHGHDIGVNFSDKGAMPVTMIESAKTQDTFALQDGYITIVPIDGDYTAHNWESVLPKELVETLND
ncbi:5'/3'-nucleotidase SurE [Pseudomaricurvus sp.]|uniref:5'/3'-nucleotidase SurE n=1 Tax=Pseudomaricurvus sp. TaxID=2004510 RepID=UPI003F6B6C82